MTKFIGHGNARINGNMLRQIKNGDLTSHSQTGFAVRGAQNSFHFAGSALSDFGASGLPVHGKITAITEAGPNGFSLSDFQLSASALRNYVEHPSARALIRAVFGGNDVFGFKSEGRAVAAASTGNDKFNMGATLDTADRINGGLGNDTVRLNGDYSHKLVIGNATLRNVESLDLAGNHSYDLALKDGVIGRLQNLKIDAHNLAATDTLTLIDAGEKNGNLFVKAGQGNDLIKTGHGDDHIGGGNGDDTIASGGGHDFVSGGAGNDRFNAGGFFDAGDRFNGGAGADTLTLNGDYSKGAVLTSDTIHNVENIALGRGHSYNLTFADGNIAKGSALTIDAGALAAGDTLSVDDSSETNGILNVTGGRGDDSVISGGGGSSVSLGGGNDVFHAGAGSDLVNGGAGNDDFYFGFNFDVSDDVNGGAGNDTLHLSTPVAGVFSLTLGSSNMHSVEHVDLGDGDYNLTIGGGGLDVAKLDINALKVDVGHTVTIDGSAALATALTLVGGAGDNILTGGSGDDTLIAGLGSNILNGGGGSDTFVFDAIGSAGQIVGFDGALDKIDVGHSVTGIDTSLLGGLLNDLGGLGTLIGSLLGAHHAMEISPILGALAGDNFLVIDQNGQSGFQAGQDLVVQLENATHLGSLSLGNFGI